MPIKNILAIMTAMITFAAAAQDRDPNPNIFSHKTATAEVILLSEGQRGGGLNTLTGATPEMIAAIAPDNTYPSATNAFFIRTQSGRNILFDTGYGRELFANLQYMGITPESIDAILMTHLHGDHIGGLVLDGKAAFSNAVLMMSELEAESANDNARKMMEQYELVTFEPGADAPVAVFDDVKAMAAYGHTPGHTAYFIDDIAIWGDLTHAMAFQMPYPRVGVTFDVDSSTAIASRLKLLEYLTAGGYTVGGMHIAWPGLGTLKSDNREGYLFTPLK